MRGCLGSTPCGLAGVSSVLGRWRACIGLCAHWPRTWVAKLIGDGLHAAPVQLEIVETGHHQPPPQHQQHHQHHQQPPYQQHQQSPYQQHQHPQQQYQALPIPYPQHQQLPIPGPQQQRVPPAGGGAAVPPLDWSRVVQVAAVLREVEGPPEQPPDQQQRVELRVWYRVSAQHAAVCLQGCYQPTNESEGTAHWEWTRARHS